MEILFFVTGYEIINLKSHVLQDGVTDCFSLNAQFILGRKQRKLLFQPRIIRFLRLKIDRYTISFIVPFPKLSKLPVNFA